MFFVLVLIWKFNGSFTAPAAAYAAANNLTFVPSAHGTTGPLHNSFSKFISDGQKPWLSALDALGVPKIQEAVCFSNPFLDDLSHPDSLEEKMSGRGWLQLP